MIADQRVLALIPARAGSKRLPGKNIRQLNGKPLIAWSVHAAQRSRHIDRIVVSTDDPAIRDAALAAGAEVPFLRPASLSGDEAGTAAVVAHALDQLQDEATWLVLLQPTSPLRVAEDIDGCLSLAWHRKVTSALSVTPLDRPADLLFRLRGDGGLSGMTGDGLAAIHGRRSQDQSRIFVLNGAVYAVSIPWFRHSARLFDDATLAYEMPPDRSIDIDTSLDFRLAETLMAERHARPDGAPFSSLV